MSAHLALALPWELPLGATGDTPEVDAPGLGWLLGRGRETALGDPDWRAWLLTAAGLSADWLQRLPAGPAARLATAEALTAAEAADWWLCAMPVHLLTGLDRLQLSPPRALGLSADEAQELCAALAAQCEPALQWQVLEPGRWLLRSATPFEVTMPEPAAALGADLRALRPVGPQARRLLALRGDCETTLHEHPVNLRRAARGLPVVNAVWLHGAGRMGPAPPRPAATLHGDDAWLHDLWRGAGAPVAPLPTESRRWTLPAGNSVVAIAPDGTEGHRSLPALDRSLLAPLAAEFRRGRVARLHLRLGARQWLLTESDRWRIWRRPRALQELPA